MKRFFSVFMVFSLAISACYCQTVDDEKYEEASRYYNAKEYDKVIPILNELVSRNHARALNFLGVCYETGRGVEKDLKKAVSFYQKSADLGFRRAQCNLGICYEFGKGVPINKEKAYFWYEKAFSQYMESAENGDADAQLEVGSFYYYGRMRSGKDYLKSIPWFEKSANQGNSNAYNSLGIIYQNALGVEKNLKKAYDYYLKGAELGNSYAQRNLAWLLLDIDFIEIDDDCDFTKQAEKWLRLAARENADHLYELAWFYLQYGFMDEFVDKDCEFYLKKASDEGSGYAQASIGYQLLLENKCSEAMELFQSAKDKGVDSFNTFYYCNYAELKVDVLIMICDFLLRNNSYQCLDAYYTNGENKDYIIAVKQEGCGVGFIQLSKNGRLVSSTAMSSKYTNLSVDGLMGDKLKVSYGDYDDKTIRPEIYFTDGYLNINALNKITDFLNYHSDYQYKNAVCCGDNSLYIFVSNDGKNYSFKKINGLKVLNSTPETIGFNYFSYLDKNSFFIQMAYDSNFNDFFCNYNIDFYYLNQDVNIDLLFVIINFAVNSEYRIGSVLSVGNDYVLVSVENKADNKKYLIKMSNAGRILAISHPFDSYCPLDYRLTFDSEKNNFYHGASECEYLDLDGLLNLFK